MWKHDKVYTKSSINNKYKGLWIKGPTSKWFYGDNNIFLGTLFFNFCLHGLQKLNCCNHVFLKYLQVLELDLKFAAIWKIKFKYLKVAEMFLQIFGFFFKHLNIDFVNILIYLFWLMEFVFITKIIPNLLKNEFIIGDIFGVFFQIQMMSHKLFWEAKGRLDAHK
jgi:hypothetical protein